MDRRSFLQTGAAVFAASGLSRRALAQEGFSTLTPVAMAKTRVAIASRNLQWLRAPDEVAKACLEMACDGLDVGVLPQPGHVDPTRVKTDLPVFVAAIRGHGLVVDTISCAITDADSPNADAILAAAAALDIRHYSWSGLRYDLTKPAAPQIEALKPRIARLAKLNEKYGVKGMYRNQSGADRIGSAIFDLLEAFKTCDPRYMSFHYDAGQAVLGGANGTWQVGLRAAGPYVGGVAFTDFLLKYRLDTNQGGPFNGTPEQLNANGQGRFAGSPVTPPQEYLTINRGGGGKSNPWDALPVPLGTGLTDMPQTAGILKEIGFEGPVEIDCQYPNGGAEAGGTALTLPRALVLGAMKRDLLMLKAGLHMGGFA